MKIYFKSVSTAILISIIGILVLSCLITYTNFKEYYLDYYVIGISSVACFIASIIIGKNKLKNGILYGSSIGIIYMALLFFISIVTNNGFWAVNISSAIFVCFILIISIIGGIIGVNLTKK